MKKRKNRRVLIIERAENRKRCREEQDLIQWIIAITRRNRALGYQV